MASSFPTGLDSFTNPNPDASLAYNTHTQRHVDLQNAIVAIETRIGVTGSAVATSVEKRLTDVAAAAHAAETAESVGALVAGATAKATPVDGDLLGLVDSAASWIIKKFSWASLKAAVLSAVFGAGYAKTVCNVTTPWLYCPSSTVVAGAAGAAYITLGTALPAAIAVPGKCYVPAVGSMSAGWYDFSSATTTQVNLTDAVATGGAFTATTNADVTGPSYTMSGGSMGPNGSVDRWSIIWSTNSAGTKTPKILWGVITQWSAGWTTFITSRHASTTWNKNAANKQSVAMASASVIFGQSSVNTVNDTSVDTASDVVVSFAFRIAQATDVLCLLAWNEKITYGA